MSIEKALTKHEQAPNEPLCRCGHGIEEHPLGANCGGGDADCWCKAYEPEQDDEWDGDEDRE